MKPKRLLPLALAIVLLTPVLRAEEGAGGHYMPGATASFIDALPGKPSFFVANLFTYHDGSASASRPFRFGGQTVADVHATAYADTIVGLYQTPVQLLGGNYAAGIGIPFVSLEDEGVVTPPIGPAFATRDTASGLGDLIWFKLGVVF